MSRVKFNYGSDVAKMWGWGMFLLRETVGVPLSDHLVFAGSSFKEEAPPNTRK